MSNKRNLKKEISNTCGALAYECIIAEEYVEGLDAEAMDKVILAIAQLQDHAISRCSISFDKTPKDFEDGAAYKKARHEYFAEAFRNLRKEFGEKVGEIVKEMNSLLPEAQREANKAAAKA